MKIDPIEKLYIDGRGVVINARLPEIESWNDIKLLDGVVFEAFGGKWQIIDVEYFRGIHPSKTQTFGLVVRKADEDRLPEDQLWWCNSHQRRATHFQVEFGGRIRRGCDPHFMLPCECVDLTGIATVEIQ